MMLFESVVQQMVCSAQSQAVDLTASPLHITQMSGKIHAHNSAQKNRILLIRAWHLLLCEVYVYNVKKFSYRMVTWESLGRVLMNIRRSVYHTHPPCSWTHTLNFSIIYRWLQYVMKSNLSLILLHRALIARSEQKKNRTTTRSDVTPPSCNKTIMTVTIANSSTVHISYEAVFKVLFYIKVR
jgi:hypothetical protein